MFCCQCIPVCNWEAPSPVENGFFLYDNTSMPYSRYDDITADCNAGYEWDFEESSQDITCNAAGWSTPYPCIKCKKSTVYLFIILVASTRVGSRTVIYNFKLFYILKNTGSEFTNYTWLCGNRLRIKDCSIQSWLTLPVARKKRYYKSF